MLYLNLVMTLRRHWKSGDEKNAAGQFTVRRVSIGVIVACVTAWAGYTGSRFDMTSEKLYSLSGSTREFSTHSNPNGRLKFKLSLHHKIPHPPIMWKPVSESLGYSTVRQARGANLEVRYVDVEPFTTQEEAERLGSMQCVSPPKKTTAASNRSISVQ